MSDDGRERRDGLRPAIRQAIFAPAGVPAPILSRLQTESARFSNPEIVERLGKLGMEASTMTPEQFAAFGGRDSQVGESDQSRQHQDRLIAAAVARLLAAGASRARNPVASGATLKCSTAQARAHAKTRHNARRSGACHWQARPPV